MEVIVDISEVSKSIPALSTKKTFAPYSINDETIKSLIKDIIEKNHI